MRGANCNCYHLSLYHGWEEPPAGEHHPECPTQDDVDEDGRQAFLNNYWANQHARAVETWGGR